MNVLQKSFWQRQGVGRSSNVVNICEESEIILVEKI